MRHWNLLFLLHLSLVVCKYSYTDKCYRYGKPIDEQRTVNYQYYFNRKGTPLSNDYIVYEYPSGNEKYLAWSYYYHHVLSNCNTTDNGFQCLNTCESVWFKVWNTTAADFFSEHCDKAFIGRYANIMDHGCNGTTDPFFYIRRSIGRKRNEEIQMNGKEPIPLEGYEPSGKCIWEYDLLGLWSLLTLVVVCSIAAVAIVILVVLIVFAQRHRAIKRKRLESSLMRNTEMTPLGVCL